MQVRSLTGALREQDANAAIVQIRALTQKGVGAVARMQLYTAFFSCNIGSSFASALSDRIQQLDIARSVFVTVAIHPDLLRVVRAELNMSADDKRYLASLFPSVLDALSASDKLMGTAYAIKFLDSLLLTCEVHELAISCLESYKCAWNGHLYLHIMSNYCHLVILTLWSKLMTTDDNMMCSETDAICEDVCDLFHATLDITDSSVTNKERDALFSVINRNFTDAQDKQRAAVNIRKTMVAAHGSLPKICVWMALLGEFFEKFVL